LLHSFLERADNIELRLGQVEGSCTTLEFKWDSLDEDLVRPTPPAQTPPCSSGPCCGFCTLLRSDLNALELTARQITVEIGGIQLKLAELAETAPPAVMDKLTHLESTEHRVTIVENIIPLLCPVTGVNQALNKHNGYFAQINGQVYQAQQDVEAVKQQLNEMLAHVPGSTPPQQSSDLSTVPIYRNSNPPNPLKGNPTTWVKSTDGEGQYDVQAVHPTAFVHPPPQPLNNVQVAPVPNCHVLPRTSAKPSNGI
jgi:hypothetical protein